MKKSSYLRDLRNFVVGFTMGTANVIPGVSGGTMLFLLGAFEELVGAIHKIASKETLRHLIHGEFRAIKDDVPWRFLIVLLFGVLFSFATMAKLFVWLLQEHTQLTYALFFGLIAGSLWSIAVRVGKWGVSAIVGLLFGTAIALWVISCAPSTTPDTWWMYLICGAICVIAMILPGLSGSFLLFLFGKYDFVWGAVGNVSHLQFTAKEVLALLWFALGCLLGLAGFSHIIRYAMEKFRSATLAALLGFMAGSLPRLWPWYGSAGTKPNAKGQLVGYGIKLGLPERCDAQLLYIILAVAVGVALAVGLELASGKKSNAKA